MTGIIRALALSSFCRRRRIAFGLAAALVGTLALLAHPVRAGDDPPGRVGRITESQGQAWQWDPEGGEWQAVQRNRPVTSGDRLSVEGNGRLELRIGSTTLRLAGGSELEMRRLDDERIEMELLRGSAALRVRSPEVAREIELLTEEGRFLPRRPGHYRVEREGDTSTATAWSGTLRFEAPDSALALSGGRSAEFWQEGAQRTTHYSWVEPKQDEFADWVARENREDDRRASSRYVSPEMTGWEDLDRHGQWESHPDYGSVWIPATVVAGWAPYRYGHWAWVRPWGWTWVDDAPWGFAPFHYGRWVMWSGRWCWTPGAYVARPVYAPALVAWVGGPSVSVGMVVGGPPVVGWVPLAPRELYVPYYPRTVSGVYLRGVNPGHPNVKPPPKVPTGPIMYTNQGVPGAVTVVPSNVLGARRPVAPAVAQVDPSVRNDLARRPWQRHDAPPPPSRVQALPGGAVPAVGPGARPGGRAVAPPPPTATPGPQVSVPGQPRPQPQPGAGAAPSIQVPQAQQPATRERVPQRPDPAVQQSAAPAPAAAMPAGPDRRGGDPGSRRDDEGSRTPGSRSVPVRVEPPRVGVPPQPVQPVQPMRPALPAQPPAARPVQRAPTPQPAAPVREVRVPQHPQRQDNHRGGGERRQQPTAPRNQMQ
jgi:hypothetical protein